jgi:hypothetical protein
VEAQRIHTLPDQETTRCCVSQQQSLRRQLGWLANGKQLAVVCRINPLRRLHGCGLAVCGFREGDLNPKVKRIRNDPKVRVAPCTMCGDVRGAWIDGRARICEDDEAAHGQQLLTQKYRFWEISSAA